MVDNVLRGRGIPASSKSLIPRVLNEFAEGGNAAAPLRLKELEQIAHLATRLWDSDATREGQLGELQLQPGSNQPPEVLERCSRGQSNPLPAARDLGIHTSLLLQDDASLLAPLSTTSSSEFAHTFDFSSDQMLFLVDQLDDDNLPSMLEFGATDLNEWM